MTIERVQGPSAQDIHLWHLRLHTIGEIDSHQVSPEERSLASRLRSPFREYYSASHHFLRQILGQYTGVEPKRLVTTRKCVTCGSTRHGKPDLLLPAGGRPLEFNLSRSGEHAVLAIGGRPVGVDIEKVRRDLDWWGLGGHVFTDEEMKWLASRPSVTSVFDAARLWTRKEAVLKLTGSGLSGGLSDTQVLSTAWLGEWTLVRQADSGVWVSEPRLHSGCSVSVAAHLPGRIRLFSMPPLVD